MKPPIAYRMRTNGLGLRGPETTLKPERTRVLFLGDSFVFGSYVENGETLPARLDEHLGSEIELEVASVCVKKIRRQPESDEALRAAFSLIATLDLRLVDTPAAEVVELALGTGLTPCDAAYLLLARQLDAELVTLDQELARAAGTTP